MTNPIEKLMMAMMPIMMKLQSQDVKLTKLHIKIDNDIDKIRIHLLVDQNSRPIAIALSDMLKVIVQLIKEQDPTADVKIL